MKKTVKKIAIILVITMFANSFSSCFSMALIRNADMPALLILTIPLDIITAPLQIFGLMIMPNLFFDNDLFSAASDTENLIYLANADSNTSAEYYSLMEKTYSLPETEIASLKQVFYSIPETERISTIEKLTSLSEAQHISLISAYNSLPETEVIYSIKRINSLSETERISLLQIFNSLSEVELDAMIKEMEYLRETEYVEDRTYELLAGKLELYSLVNEGLEQHKQGKVKPMKMKRL